MKQTRADIQALRALAVGAVIGYHLWPHRLQGGYVGVDVFFVISGFLITGQLVAEAERTGRVRLGRFWARRAKRLVPASTVVLLATTVGVLVLVPLQLWRQFLGEVVASALQLENWRLAHDSVDYLASDNARSPVQHFWSLATEEQFYVVLPLLLLLVTLLTRRRPGARIPTVMVVLGIATVLSLAWSVHQTRTDAGVAYFSTLTRAWEFGCGALLACLPRAREAREARPERADPRSWGLLSPVPWLGVAAVLTACLRFDDTTLFPGYLAGVPVLGATLAIATGRDTLLDRLGSWRPVALAGRVSYAAYLWHLPLLVLLPYATTHDLTRDDKLGILAATVLLSVASTFLLEEPMRFRAVLLGGRRPLVVGLWCTAAVALVVGVASYGVLDEEQQSQQLATETRQVLSDGTQCLGAQAMDPAYAPCLAPVHPNVIVPDPVNAAEDDDNLPACWDSTDGKPDVCHLGTTTGYTKKLLALGDSHNNALIGVYRSIGLHQGWRIDVAGMGSCYITDAVQTAPSTSLADDCASWRRQVLELARDGGYDAILVTHSTHNRPVKVPKGSTRIQVTVDGLVSAWRKLPNVPIIAIHDNPRPRADVLTCVSEHRSDAAAKCAQTRKQAFADPDGNALAAQQVPKARVVDLSDFYCTDTICPPVIGHVLVYRDGSHITATFAGTLEPYLERAVVAAIEE